MRTTVGSGSGSGFCSPVLLQQQEKGCLHWSLLNLGEIKEGLHVIPGARLNSCNKKQTTSSFLKPARGLEGTPPGVVERIK